MDESVQLLLSLLIFQGKLNSVRKFPKTDYLNLAQIPRGRLKCDIAKTKFM